MTPDQRHWFDTHLYQHNIVLADTLMEMRGDVEKIEDHLAIIEKDRAKNMDQIQILRFLKLGLNQQIGKIRREIERTESLRKSIMEVG